MSQLMESDAFGALMHSVLQNINWLSTSQPHPSPTSHQENRPLGYSEPHITLPNGTFVTLYVAIGCNLMERIDNWHRTNDPRLVSTSIPFPEPVAHASPILTTLHISEPVPSSTLQMNVINSANRLENTEDFDESKAILHVAHTNIDQVQRHANIQPIRDPANIETTDYPLDESNSFILPRATPDSKLDTLPSRQPTKHTSTLLKDITSAAAIAKLVAHVVKNRENCHEEIGEDFIAEISSTQVGAKGGASTAAVVCRRRESESESGQ